MQSIADMMKPALRSSKWLSRTSTRTCARNFRTRIKLSGFGSFGLLLVVLLSLRTLGAAVSIPAPSPETIFIGEFVTLDPAHPKAEAVAVLDGRIIAIGSRAEVEALATKNTRRITIKGTALPGFADAHVHVEGVGEQFERLDLRGLSKADILAKIAEAAHG